MTGTPTITGPDGVERTALAFSTNAGFRFVSGGVNTSTAVEVQVSVNGAAFTNDPDLVVFDGARWSLPNPTAYPTGLYLIPGLNTIAVRSVSVSGSISGSATASITYVPSLSVVAPAPTNLSVLRKDRAVVVTAEPSGTSTFVGMNVYAASAAGGGATGYTRVNVNTVVTGATVEEATSVGSIEQEYLTPTPAVDPLYAVIFGQQQDQFGNVLSADFADTLPVPETATRLRTTVTVVAVQARVLYSFEHNRAASATSNPPTVFVSEFSNLSADVPLYYVVSGVYFDPSTQVEVESPFSVEVAGNPLRVTAQVGAFPVVSRQVLVRETIASILRTNPQIRVDPGSVLRDTFIDPFANEAERLRFVVDFLHRAQSFAALLSIDDPTGSGTSIAVSSSNYKTALKSAFRLNDDAEVQDVIDRSFEALASNFGIFRRDGRAARGDVTFYTSRRPTETVFIPVGSLVSAGSTTYSVVQGASLPLSQLASYYDPVSRRYSVTVAVQATTGGAAGNVGAGQIRRVNTGPTSLLVTNASAIFGGTNEETNSDLAVRARNALASVDSGTRQGYLQTAADVAGVERVSIVAAGDALMMRDMYEGRHIGGKVDVWVQGSANSIVTDVFAFEYQLMQDIHFELVGAVANLTFRAVDSSLSESTPIVQILDAPGVGYSFRNASTGQVFDLTGASIVRYDTVQLNTAIPQPTVSLTDVVLGDYRKAVGTDYVFSRQPVTSISSVTGTLTGTLPDDDYALYHPDNPLLLGGSTLAKDFLRITSGVPVQSGGILQVTNEAHTMVGEYIEYLNSLGVDLLTILVVSEDGLVTYATSGDPSGFYDYAVVPGTTTTPTSIVRIPTGRIADGETVLVSYQHGENFTVTYEVNQVPGQVQLAVDARRHITADVLAKAAVPWSINLTLTVILAQGVQRSRVNSALQNAISTMFNRLRLGDPLRQSDVIATVERVSGVSYVVVPLTVMAVAEGSTIVQDPVRSAIVGDSMYIAGWSTPTVSVWLLVDALTAVPRDAGGFAEDFRAVTQDDVDLVLVNTEPSTNLGRGAGRAFIVGAGGISIPGISDDATLNGLGYLTDSEVLDARAALTEGRILVSTSVDDPPIGHVFKVTYVVGNDTRVYDLDPGAAEYLRLNPNGGLTVTYDEDR
jgi:hypothetical protein